MLGQKWWHAGITHCNICWWCSSFQPLVQLLINTPALWQRALDVVIFKVVACGLVHSCMHVIVVPALSEVVVVQWWYIVKTGKI